MRGFIIVIGLGCAKIQFFLEKWRRLGEKYVKEMSERGVE